MKYAGLEYELVYSDTANSEKGPALEFFQTHLPTDLVCPLIAAAYSFPEAKEAVIDSLSPFQVLSKQWACTVLSHVLGEDYERSPFVYFGSWFGQLNSLMSRRVPGYNNHQVVLIDQEPLACQVAKTVLDADVWQKSFRQSPIGVVEGDALKFDLQAFSEETGADPIVLWTGIEHFEAYAVQDYIEEHERCNALYLLQGTNMPADDHVNPIHSCAEMESYFDGDPIYSARLHTELGDRFLIVFTT